VGRTNIKSSIVTRSRFRKPYINSQDYPDYMRIVPAKYVYMSNPDYPHSLYKKPYAEYSEDYPAMELTWNQDPIVFDWRPDWDWTLPDYDIPDIEVPVPRTSTFHVPEDYIFSVRNGDIDWISCRVANEGYRWGAPLSEEGYMVDSGYIDGSYMITRTYAIYDLAPYSGVITSAQLRFHAGTIGSFGTVCAYLAYDYLGDPGSIYDYDAFPSYHPADHGPWGMTNVNGPHNGPGTDGEYIINLSDLAISYLNLYIGELHKVYFVLRSYTYDEKNVEPDGTANEYVALGGYSTAIAIALRITGTLEGPLIL